MSKLIDLSEQRFGRLTVRHLLPDRRHGNVMWQCECDCGVLVRAVAADLRTGHKKSCGCLKREMTIARNKAREPMVRGTCGVEECVEREWVRGLCRPHYHRDWHSKGLRKPQGPGRMLRKYGLTEDAFALLLESQGGVCAICKREPGATRLYVDHDHSCCPGQATGGSCLRGLLCRNCNFLIGLAGESQQVLASAAEYLKIYDTA